MYLVSSFFFLDISVSHLSIIYACSIEENTGEFCIRMSAQVRPRPSTAHSTQPSHTTTTTVSSAQSSSASSSAAASAHMKSNQQQQQQQQQHQQQQHSSHPAIPRPFNPPQRSATSATSKPTHPNTNTNANTNTNNTNSNSNINSSNLAAGISNHGALGPLMADIPTALDELEDLYQQGVASREERAFSDADLLLRKALLGCDRAEHQFSNTSFSFNPNPHSNSTANSNPHSNSNAAQSLRAARLLHADTLLALALTSTAAGNLAEALERYDGCVAYVERTFGAQSTLLVGPLLNMALVLMEQQAWPIAYRHLMRAKTLAEALRDGERLMLSDVYHNLAVVCEALRRDDDAAKMYEHAFHGRCIVAGGLLAESGRMAIEALRGAARCHAHTAHYAKAIKNLERALHLPQSRDALIQIRLSAAEEVELTAQLGDMYCGAGGARELLLGKRAFQHCRELIQVRGVKVPAELESYIRQRIAQLAQSAGVAASSR
jgi:tetratricopeptide (TPR) repeat protein